MAKLQREKVREKYLSIVGEEKDELKHEQPSPDVKKSTLDTFVNSTQGIRIWYPFQNGDLNPPVTQIEGVSEGVCSNFKVVT